MIAFQLIPSTSGLARERRLDLASLAGRFGEREEALPSGARRQSVARLAVMILVLLGAIGDTLLISRREALASCLAAAHPIGAPERATTF